MRSSFLLSLFITALLLLVSFNTPGYSRDLKARLVESTSVDAIIRDFERFKGFGKPEWARFSNGGKELFVIWNDPFSGRSAVFIQAYFYNGKKWILFLDDLIDNTPTLSVMVLQYKNELVLYSSDKEILRKYPLINLTPLYQKRK